MSQKLFCSIFFYKLPRCYSLSEIKYTIIAEKIADNLEVYNCRKKIADIETVAINSIDFTIELCMTLELYSIQHLLLFSNELRWKNIRFHYSRKHFKLLLKCALLYLFQCIKSIEKYWEIIKKLLWRSEYIDQAKIIYNLSKSIGWEVLNKHTNNFYEYLPLHLFSFKLKYVNFKLKCVRFKLKYFKFK